MRISSPRKHILYHPSQNIKKLLNMTTACNFAINTRWVNADQTTSTLHRHPKRLKPTKTYLFNLLSQLIIKDIDIQVSGIEHCKKHKDIIINIHPLCKPTLFTFPQELWAPYHNLSVYSGWYNECYYAWAHRCI